MKCIHGISIRKPCEKCRQDRRKERAIAEKTWGVGKPGYYSDQDWFYTGCQQEARGHE